MVPGVVHGAHVDREPVDQAPEVRKDRYCSTTVASEEASVRTDDWFLTTPSPDPGRN